uniref:Uncharacterized protein n=1 Tax=Arundo donax TaxID=35708 RepID=A0A0A9B033_ARUDO
MKIFSHNWFTTNSTLIRIVQHCNFILKCTVY